MFFSSPDIDLLFWLNHHIVPHSIPVLRMVSLTTTYTSIALAFGVLAISLAKKSKVLRQRFFILAAVLIVAAIASQALKTFVYRERPFATYPFIVKLSDGGGSSFPSGHTQEAFAMAAALLFLFPGKRTAIPLYLWAVLVAYSRMALGVHYPSDVLAGMITGTLIGWVVPWAFTRFGYGGKINNPA